MQLFARTAVALALLSQGGVAYAQSQRIAFIGCPVLRDMELPERPCWFAQDGETLYFLGMQGDIFPPVIFYPPQLKHRVLVEAELADGPDVCGGKPLRNVRASVLPEIDLTCDTVLPKAGFEQGPIGRPSPPYRPGRGLATDPRTWPKPRTDPPPPQPPFSAKTFKIPFRFNGDFITLEEAFIAANVVNYFIGAKASKLVVEVHRDRVELSNGQVVEEGPEVAQWRSDLVRKNFTEWGIPTDKIAIRSDFAPSPGGAFVSLTVEP